MSLDQLLERKGDLCKVVVSGKFSPQERDRTDLFMELLLFLGVAFRIPMLFDTNVWRGLRGIPVASSRCVFIQYIP